MTVLLVVLALGLVAGGGAAIFVGFDILLGDRGLPMIVLGAAVMSTGFILIGLATVARAVRRMERRFLAAGRLAPQDQPSTMEEELVAVQSPPPAARAFTLRPGFDEMGATIRITAPPLVGSPASPIPDPEPAPDDEMPRLPLPEPPAEPPSRPSPGPAAPGVVGRYRSGGNAYTMFTDGSIEAETPAGRHRFDSLDELRAFVAAGGEKGEPS